MTARKPAPRRSPGALGKVQQLPSGRWRARYTRDGATFKAPRTFATKDEALTWLAGERSDRARGVWRDPRLGRETLADYAAAWLASRPDLAPRTLAGYRVMVERYIVPRVGGARGVELGLLELSAITPAVVRAWRAAVLTEIRERIARRAAEAKPRKHPAREWARSQGFAVHDTGKLPTAALAAWEAAGRPNAPAAPAIEDASADPGRTTAANVYRCLRTILNTAVHDGQIQANPCQIKGAGMMHAAERPTATPGEVAAIAERMPPHLAAAVTLAAWSGLRFGELFALAHRHVDLDARTVRVERAIVSVPGEPVKFGKPKTHTSRRTVHLPGFVAETLRAHLAEHVPAPPDALLFTNRNGQPLTPARISHAYKRARAAVGRPDLRWHDLRHTGATLAYSTGASVREVQNRLGHSTMRAASIYAHAADDSDRVLAERLDALYGDARGELPESPRRLRAA